MELPASLVFQDMPFPKVHLRRRRPWAALMVAFIIVSAHGMPTEGAQDPEHEVEPTAASEEQYSKSKYVAYFPSSGLGVILSAPHGGDLYPDSIQDRDAGCWNSDNGSCIWRYNCGTKNFTKCKAVTVTDIYTMELAIELRMRLCHLFHGACPAAVLSLLGRSKFDANRDQDEATFGVEEVVKAFQAYHKLIDSEKKIAGGTGLFVDIHGHGHKLQRAELGYLIRGPALNSGEPLYPNQTSIRHLAETAPVPFDDLLRGSVSFGAYLGNYGFDSVPSPKHRGPGNHTYFNGGYNTRRHGSLLNGSFDAIQIESAHSHRTPKVRPYYVRALACTIKNYYCKYYHVTGGAHGTRTLRSVSSMAKRVSHACTEDSECDRYDTLNLGSEINCVNNARSGDLVFLGAFYLVGLLHLCLYL